MRRLRSTVVWRVLVYTGAITLFLGAAGPPDDAPAFSQRINAFTLDLLKQAATQDNAPGNVVLSAQGVFECLAMSYIASGGQTRTELAKALHFPEDNEQLIKEVAEQRKRLRSTAKHEKVDVGIANAVWLDETYADFREDYKKTAEKAFGASLRLISLKQSDHPDKAINRWVADATDGAIRSLVAPGDFASKSVPELDVIDEPALVATNAIYFKADWGSRFDKALTRDRTFHVDTTIEAPTEMMNQRSRLRYAVNNDLKFVEIPYIGGDYSMYVILPREIMPIDDLLETATADAITTLARRGFPHEVDLLLPKFDLTSRFDAKDALSRMGVNEAFDSSSADFREMIDIKFEAFRVYINDIHHAASIQVDEEGTEATAATATVHYSFGCGASSPPMQAQFHANRPFIFMIVDNTTHSALFAGWISNPAEIAS